MASETRWSRDDSDQSPISRILEGFYLKIRRSFLFAFAIAGLVLTLFAVIIEPLIGGLWAGLIVASGLIVFVANLIGILLYRIVEGYWK